MPRLFSIVEFTKGYRVNPRNPELLVASHLLLRSLASISSRIGKSRVFGAIEGLGVYSSSLLPLLRSRDGCYKVVLPIGRVLRKLCDSVLGLEPSYITLGAANSIVDTCHDSSSVVELIRCVSGVLEGLKEAASRLKTEEARVVLQHRYTVAKVAKVLALRDEVEKLGNEVFEEPLRLAVEVRNVIDRVTAAANPFVVMGIRAFRELVALIGMPDGLEGELIDCLELLGETGIGGGRSRGWGTFRLCRDSRLCSDDERILAKASEVSRLDLGGYYMLLGTLPIVASSLDPRESLLEVRDISGFLPSSDIVSRLYVATAGSVIRLRKPLPPDELMVKVRLGEGSYSFYPFTTFAIGA